MTALRPWQRTTTSVLLCMTTAAATFNMCSHSAPRIATAHTTGYMTFTGRT